MRMHRSDFQNVSKRGSRAALEMWAVMSSAHAAAIAGARAREQASAPIHFQLGICYRARHHSRVRGSKLPSAGWRAGAATRSGPSAQWQQMRSWQQPAASGGSQRCAWGHSGMHASMGSAGRALTLGEIQAARCIVNGEQCANSAPIRLREAQR